MKRNYSFKEWLQVFGCGCLYGLAILAFVGIVGFLGFEIYLNVRYWNTPVSEIPYWAATLLFNRG